jgi:hypothetical protein
MVAWTAVDMQRRGKHASVTIELLLETVFSIRSVQYLNKTIPIVGSQAAVDITSFIRLFLGLVHS